MTRLSEASRVVEPLGEELPFAPVNRARLARYLELPSVAELDEMTDAEIRKLDGRRSALLSFWNRAVVLPIEHVDGRWIQPAGDIAPIEATPAYGRELLASGADSLIIAAFTLGARVDEKVKAHLGGDELFEAFVLKQWSATMAEQARAWLTHALSGWADHRGCSLLPYDGPGYNGWPLQTVNPLLEMVYRADEPRAARPISAMDSGVLLPINSMLIVYGMTPRRAARARRESVPQCDRCAMSNCRYRMMPLAGNPREPETTDVAC